MADVINLDENSGSTQNPKQDSDTQSDPEQTTQSKSQISQKIQAVVEKFGGYAEHFKEILKTNKVLGIGIIAVAVLVFVLMMLLVVFALTRPKPQEEITPPAPISRKIVEPAPILSGSKRPDIDGTELGNMIKKASILYTQGDRMEALDLFENIAAHSQSLAAYNLGVIRIKEGNYKEAIKTFDSAINTGEDISVSAFNAAYSAYMLGDSNLFEYYLGISASYLFYAANDPLYSYLYGLLDYYRGFYFESLSPFLNPNSKSYAKESKKMASEVFLVFGDEYNALAHLKPVAQKADNLAIGLLHARVGEYAQARQYLYEYLGYRVGDLQALMALQLIELKGGNYKESALLLEKLNAKPENAEIFNTYPIRVKLRDDLFDINLAQQHFWKREFEHNKILGYKLLFYYSPLRVFDVQNTLDLLRDENLHAMMNIQSVQGSSLQEGQGVSRVNHDIVLALRTLARSQDIRSAINSMEESLKDYPNHAIMHYNLGVLYAQMSDFDGAYLHFIRAYHLDTQDVISGIFALMCAELTYRDTKHLSNALSNDFAELNFKDDVERDFLLSLFRYTSDMPADSMQWVNALGTKGGEYNPLRYALLAVYGIQNGDSEQIVGAFEELQKTYKQDVVTNTMHNLGKYFGRNLKEVALQMNIIYKDNTLDMRSIYYGPALARELYIYVGFVTGALHTIQSELETRLIAETSQTIGILQALGLLNIYSNNFEKAFAIYNSLLDDLKEDDSQTRFLAAISAMGANRHENAVVLLQLVKMESATNLEARYALGLLYQEAKNIKAAIQHYEKLASRNFESEFFDFEIDTSEIIESDR